MSLGLTFVMLVILILSYLFISIESRENILVLSTLYINSSK